MYRAGNEEKRGVDANTLPANRRCRLDIDLLTAVPGLVPDCNDSISYVGQVYYDNIQPIPEPAAMAPLGLGGLLIVRRRRHAIRSSWYNRISHATMCGGDMREETRRFRLIM